jgi:hypothetical protein
VNRYWTLKNSTLAATSYGATLSYLASDIDGGGPATGFVVARGEFCVTSAGVRTCNPWGRPTAGAISATQANASGLLIVSGDGDADFVVGASNTARFIRQKELIYSREQY